MSGWGAPALDESGGPGDEQQNDGDTQQQPEQQQGEEGMGGVDVVEVVINHRGEKTSLADLTMYTTIAEVKNMFAEKTGRQIVAVDVKDDVGHVIETNSGLAHGATGLRDNAQLSDLNVDPGSAIELLGQYTVFVKDEKCGLNTPVEVYAFKTLSDLLHGYFEQSKRTRRLRPGMGDEHDRGDCRVTFDGDLLSAGDLSRKLFDLEIKDQTSLEYEALPYAVTIVEEKGMERREMRFEIADHFTVQMIKEIFSKKTDQDSSFEPTILTDNDKLVLNNEDLDENEKVYMYNIREGAELKLMMEDVAETFKYECANCGADVALKPEDVIRCRLCGYRIVYKYRTKKPCQYRAR